MIPNIAHFIWIGKGFPFLNWAAAASARRHGQFSRVVLHHTHELGHEYWWRELAASGVECRKLEPERELIEVGGQALVSLFRDLERPEAISNVLRIALLAQHGGVYLDLDTLTRAPLTPLLASASAFCGAERIAFPAGLWRENTLAAWALAYARTLLRDGCRRSRSGVALFRRVERLYPIAANNAVLGARPGHPLLSELLRRMLALPSGRRRVRYALGTRLLQDTIAEGASRDLVVHEPDVFYPLGPEISEHWFRLDTRADLASVLSPRTRVVHWYSSVRVRQRAARIDPEWIRRNALRQPISALTRELLPEVGS